jgi:CRISPR/Cas system-associated endoribonuclease Cas2
MSDVALYLVVIAVGDAPRRARVRRLLASYGNPVNSDAYEVATNARGMRALQVALGPDLRSEDTVRIYPVCGHCRQGVTIHGPGELASLPVAYVY